MSKPEIFALVRIAVWVILTPIILLTSLKDAVWIVILLSLYANGATDLSTYRAAKADRHEQESSS